MSHNPLSSFSAPYLPYCHLPPQTVQNKRKVSALHLSSLFTSTHILGYFLPTKNSRLIRFIFFHKYSYFLLSPGLCQFLSYVCSHLVVFCNCFLGCIAAVPLFFIVNVDCPVFLLFVVLFWSLPMFPSCHFRPSVQNLLPASPIWRTEAIAHPLRYFTLEILL